MIAFRNLNGIVRHWGTKGILVLCCLGCGTTGLKNDSKEPLTKASELWEDGKRDEAITTLDRAIAKNDSAELRSAKLNYLLKDARYDEALKLTREAIEKFPEAADLYQLLGKIYRTKGDDEKAERAYQKAVRLYSRDIRSAPWKEEALIQRAITYYFLKDFDNALRDCRQAQGITLRENRVLDLIADIERIQNGEEPELTDNLERDRDL